MKGIGWEHGEKKDRVNSTHVYEYSTRSRKNVKNRRRGGGGITESGVPGWSVNVKRPTKLSELSSHRLGLLGPGEKKATVRNQ